MGSHQVLPLPASDEVTVTIVADDTPKVDEVFEPRTLKRTLAVGTLYTAVSLGAFFTLVLAFKFISEGNGLWANDITLSGIKMVEAEGERFLGGSKKRARTLSPLLETWIPLGIFQSTKEFPVQSGGTVTGTGYVLGTQSFAAD
ncbi:hypothetical protein PF005_g15283 [Phytophthora fragariae]|uniref:Uncharacterized protein n=2 Tax=Phytophthora TaxID=4783 RepID=A0A6A3RM30_9STRA|nr:hypothetical protein PF003_g31272 [Phytophthora fragariae]KAE9023849.1 hypothetical protein PR001_g12814 [Phytophthora rubi]KAE8933626.1 hypothetical protein PF009_g16379 [Phytophthora fragariae]KAE8984943.1 hypothetical protein PF011_g20584 [Phytophthora fragariae]KAE9099984.1 hypothetical protein PF010_g14983 [Phytophthora fragariae]